jgi:hypothetical protein
LATGAKGKDEEGYRAEFIKLITQAQTLAKGKNFDGDDVVIKPVGKK